jgi:hypothetical protein
MTRISNVFILYSCMLVVKLLLFVMVIVVYYLFISLLALFTLKYYEGKKFSWVMFKDWTPESIREH